jgi:hypothetical protein
MTDFNSIRLDSVTVSKVGCSNSQIFMIFRSLELDWTARQQILILDLTHQSRYDGNATCVLFGGNRILIIISLICLLSWYVYVSFLKKLSALQPFWYYYSVNLRVLLNSFGYGCASACSHIEWSTYIVLDNYFIRFGHSEELGKACDLLVLSIWTASLRLVLSP